MTATSRVQLALNVADLDEAIGFYSKLFATEPTKVRAGYANFAVVDPPLKLVLFETATAGQAGALNHLGVELAGADDVAAAGARFALVGLETRASSEERCCHAVQEKVYVSAPGVPLGKWEFYTVLGADPTGGVEDDSGTCCPGPSSTTAGIGDACCA